ncbi:hypothetical protein [Methylopila turkensis]|uniref:Uncharacterized protein n=1 Tax=Methylopila turkensis TaxID=1437816 RepID=A0A9W6N635_9HYPH|nr:hypothetical protein [Methylopila turkensis]GLK78912.1 hypothetical protein GCM10008174_06530 [Methylopila turkensis]
MAAPPKAAGPVVATEFPIQAAFCASAAVGESAIPTNASQRNACDNLDDVMVSLSEIIPRCGLMDAHIFAPYLRLTETRLTIKDGFPMTAIGSAYDLKFAQTIKPHLIVYRIVLK